ncbi:hypothetical protein [Kibdelosporangium phytohabitans]|uniref:Uncharacterized protein n=1 Tax=Kibdelosporangium phytohabitans TaxID=860235 RepID=A0A0N9I7Y2_9PSEU|nr:hypothetical protein [Kibdelosporangium phytohabitans]ALG10736.1 hypothetical protein AOZ06_31010 [Kibdelosporangium phytohabitans]MBE1461878.1 hypothetical protein [Kibdelosporangium phytohabitans]
MYTTRPCLAWTDVVAVEQGCQRGTTGASLCVDNYTVECGAKPPVAVDVTKYRAWTDEHVPTGQSQVDAVD